MVKGYWLSRAYYKSWSFVSVSPWLKFKRGGGEMEMKKEEDIQYNTLNNSSVVYHLVEASNHSKMKHSGYP